MRFALKTTGLLVCLFFCLAVGVLWAQSEHRHQVCEVTRKWPQTQLHIHVAGSSILVYACTSLVRRLNEPSPWSYEWTDSDELLVVPQLRGFLGFGYTDSTLMATQFNQNIERWTVIPAWFALVVFGMPLVIWFR